jgi:hypothetical protein
LRGFEEQLKQIEPDRKARIKARENYTLFRSFISSDDGGTRLEHLRILYELWELFPDTNDAYITGLIIYDRPRTTLTTNYDIEAKGRVRQGDISTEFMDQLNSSDLFQEAKQGSNWTSDTSDSLYPFNFSVNCNLKRTNTPAKPIK